MSLAFHVTSLKTSEKHGLGKVCTAHCRIKNYVRESDSPHSAWWKEENGFGAGSFAGASNLVFTAWRMVVATRAVTNKVIGMPTSTTSKIFNNEAPGEKELTWARKRSKVRAGLSKLLKQDEGKCFMQVVAVELKRKPFGITYKP